MDSAIIMQYKHKEKKIYINISMKKNYTIKNNIQYYKINNKKMCKTLYLI